MKNPRDIEAIVDAATYKLNTYKVTGEGLADAESLEVKFVKGNKADPNVFRQDGLMTETVIALAIKQLESVNVGNLENEHTTNAIAHLNAALAKLDKRTAERKAKGTLGTYQK